MPANLTPEYFKAEKWYRSASTNDEKILALERMLSVMPKHKGTDHLRADLRRKLSKLKESPPGKVHGKHVDIFHIPRSGSGQVALLGTPNSGKSSIVAALTNAKVNVEAFPFATGVPVPGMLQFEDIQIQLIDTPPITADGVAGGQVGTYRNCDLIAVCIDLSGDIGGQLQVCIDFLESRRLLIDGETGDRDANGNLLGRKVFCICTKADIAQKGSLQTFKRLCNRDFDFIEVSTADGTGIEQLKKTIFRLLGIIRIYTKKPGKPVDTGEPFTLPAGSTVIDLARAVHRELAEKLKFARIWGTGVYDGQNVQRNHILNDKDVIELHFS